MALQEYLRQHHSSNITERDGASLKDTQRDLQAQITMLAGSPFPKTELEEPYARPMLLSWAIMEDIDRLPYEEGYDTFNTLFARLGHELIKERTVPNTKPYDGRILNFVALGMARAYESFNQQDKQMLWGNDLDQLLAFSILTDTIQRKATPIEGVPTVGRLGLEVLLLDLVEAHPELLDISIVNPLLYRPDKYIFPTIDCSKIILWDIRCMGKVDNQYLKNAFTEVGDRLSKHLSKAMRQKINTAF